MTMLPPAIGIDPGQSGSVVYMVNNTLEVWRSFDTLRDLAVAVRMATLRAIGRPTRVVIEQVSARPGQGVCSMFSFGRSTGTAFGAFMAMWPECPVYEVVPQTWQKWYRGFIDIPSGPGTFDSRVVAPKVLTDEMLDLCRVRAGKKVNGKFGLDHNACDAALLAVWGANQPEGVIAEYLSEHYQAPPKPTKKK